MIHRSTLLGRLLVLWACVSTFVAVPTKAEERDEPRLPMRIPVLVIKYFPVRGDLIDVEVTGDWGAPLDEIRQKTDEMTQELLSCTPARLSLPRLQERKAPSQPGLHGGENVRVPGAASHRRPSWRESPDDGLQQDHAAGEHQAVGRAEGRQGSVDLGLSRRGARTSGNRTWLDPSGTSATATVIPKICRS